MMRTCIFLIAGMIVSGGVVGSASADPQLLAAVPSGGPLEMVCDDQTCEAEFSAICLQSERSFPVKGTPYKVMLKDVGAIALLGQTSGGKDIKLSSGLVRVKSQRSHTAVRFYVERDQLPRTDIKSITVNFNRLIALFPVGTEADSNPQTAADITTATQGISRAAAFWIEINADRVAVARIASRMSNGLPDAGIVSSDKSDRIWRTVVDQETGLSPKARAGSRDLISDCQQRTDITLHHCLNYRHDQVMRDLNIRYWNLLKPGS